MSTSEGGGKIIDNDLVLYIDPINPKSYVNNNIEVKDLVTDYGKYDLSWVNPHLVADEYDNEIFVTDIDSPRQSMYNLSTDTSYIFSSLALYIGGVQFDTTEIINGKPVAYSAGFANTVTNNTPNFRRFEYQGNNTWSNTFTKTLTNRRQGKINVDNYNKTNGRSDLWLSSSSNGSTVYLTLHQWNGSDYVQHDFTSKTTPFFSWGSKFVTSCTSVDYGRVFLFLYSYSSTNSVNSCIVDMKYTGGTYTDINNWTTTLIAGGTGTTSGNGFSTGISITSTPALDGYVGVSVNGVWYVVGNGVTTTDCYFSNDGGTTAKSISNIESGDTLIWNGVVSGFDLDTSDRVDFYYNVIV